MDYDAKDCSAATQQASALTFSVLRQDGSQSTSYEYGSVLGLKESTHGFLWVTFRLKREKERIEKEEEKGKTRKKNRQTSSAV